MTHRPLTAAAALALTAAVASGCAGPTAGPAHAAPAAPRVTLSAPASLGSWRQSADQSAARPLAAALTDASDTFSVRYEQPPRTLIVLGGLAHRFQPDDATIQQDQFFTALNKRLGASHPTAPRWFAGHIGGETACATTDSAGTAYAACTWTGPGVLVAFLVPGTDLDAAAREVEPLVGDFVTISP